MSESSFNGCSFLRDKSRNNESSRSVHAAWRYVGSENVPRRFVLVIGVVLSAWAWMSPLLGVGEPRLDVEHTTCWACWATVEPERSRGTVNGGSAASPWWVTIHDPVELGRLDRPRVQAWTMELRRCVRGAWVSRPRPPRLFSSVAYPPPSPCVSSAMCDVRCEREP